MLMVVSELESKHSSNQFSSKRWGKNLFFSNTDLWKYSYLKDYKEKSDLVSPQQRLPTKQQLQLRKENSSL